jgi:hypothetical protein
MEQRSFCVREILSVQTQGSGMSRRTMSVAMPGTALPSQNFCRLIHVPGVKTLQIL